VRYSGTLLGMSDSDTQWYYCTADGSVRQGKESRGLDRMGPYPDAETARNALAIAKSRNDAADAADREWRD